MHTTRVPPPPKFDSVGQVAMAQPTSVVFPDTIGVSCGRFPRTRINVPPSCPFCGLWSNRQCFAQVAATVATCGFHLNGGKGVAGTGAAPARPHGRHGPPACYRQTARRPNFGWSSCMMASGLDQEH